MIAARIVHTFPETPESYDLTHAITSDALGLNGDFMLRIDRCSIIGTSRDRVSFFEHRGPRLAQLPAGEFTGLGFGVSSGGVLYIQRSSAPVVVVLFVEAMEVTRYGTIDPKVST